MPHYFHVHTNRRMLRADGKRVHLSTFLFYFMVAGFTYWSLLPQVDNISCMTSVEYLLHVQCYEVINRQHLIVAEYYTSSFPAD